MTKSKFSPLRVRHGSRELTLAREVLTEFVCCQAERTRQKLGFGWVAQVEAPSTYDELCSAYERSYTTGQPLPISSENTEAIIYTSTEANISMRFWHDVNHVRHQLTFDLDDELELGLWHLSVLEAAGFDRDTLLWKLLHADLIGQAHVMAFTQRFPIDQERFVTLCVLDGFDRGLLYEVRRKQ